MKILFFMLLSIQFLLASPQPLKSGEVVTKTVKQKEKQFYTIAVPTNKHLRVNLTDLDADIDLYVKKGEKVRIRFNDCYSSNSNTENEKCTLSNEGEITRYTILVYGFKESSYKLKATIEDAETIPTLTNDPIEDAVEYKAAKQYKLFGKKGKTITVTLSDLTADADLRVKVGKKANLRTFDCKSTNGGSKSDICTITPKKDATVYVHVYGYKAANYSLKAVQEVVNPCLTIDALKNKIKNHEDISHANTSCITNMDYLFDHLDFNQDISSWDVSNVTSMNHMFYNAEVFNQDISSWNTKNVTDMNNMFSYAKNFSNHNLSNWNVKKVSSKKWFVESAGKGNIPPKWHNLNTVLINKAKKHCQNVHNESRSVVCSDLNNLVYIINSEDDIGASPKIFSKAYAIHIENSKEKIKIINQDGRTDFIKLRDTELIAIRILNRNNNLGINVYNSLGKNVLSIQKAILEEIIGFVTTKNGKELVYTYSQMNDDDNNVKTFKDIYDISDTSSKAKLISHTKI